MKRPTVAEVEQRRADISAALASTSRHLRVSRAAAARAVRQRLCAWVLPPEVQRTALIIYASCEYTAEPATRYLSVVARLKRWPMRPSPEVDILVEDMFLSLSLIHI